VLHATCHGIGIVISIYNCYTFRCCWKMQPICCTKSTCNTWRLL